MHAHYLVSDTPIRITHAHYPVSDTPPLWNMTRQLLMLTNVSGTPTFKIKYGYDCLFLDIAFSPLINIPISKLWDYFVLKLFRDKKAYIQYIYFFLSVDVTWHLLLS